MKFKALRNAHRPLNGRAVQKGARIRNGPRERANAPKGLTNSLDLTKERLMAKPTPFTSNVPCVEIAGDLNQYQAKAADAWYIEGKPLQPWDWITPLCGNVRCIETEHLAIQPNVKLRYPANVCIYCGRPGYTKDHLLPRNWSGEAARHYVVTVPACGTCNMLLRDTLTWSITERRALAHERIRKHFRKVLGYKDYTPKELNEFGYILRKTIIEGLENKREVLQMLKWPTDPGYDLRALENSGIDDPWAIGLLLPDNADLAAHVGAIA